VPLRHLRPRHHHLPALQRGRGSHASSFLLTFFDQLLRAEAYVHAHSPKAKLRALLSSLSICVFLW
jgi:hypothetical protein